jgi:microcystin-dependent protein
MAFVRPKARILERSITAGSGPYALAGSVDGSYRSFASFMAIGDATEATVVEPGVAFWTGIVTYSGANQITLTTVEEASGAFGTGTKEIFAGGLASRALMREDMSGEIVTGGTSTAYTVASFRAYDTLTRLDGKPIAFSPHATNGATVTLNVDGLGAKPLRAAPSTELFPGVLIQGTPYMALYNHIDQVFYLHGFFGNPFNVPLGSGLDYWGSITPNSAFVFPVGQAISRITYASLFSGNPWSIGTTFGSGDGSTTFNLPDKRGRLSAAANNMGGGTGSAWPGLNFGLSGGVAGASMSLGTSNMASYTPSGSVTISNGAITLPATAFPSFQSGSPTLQAYAITGGALPVNQNPSSGSFSGNNNGGTSAAFSVAQPYIACNYIMRVL